MNNQAGEISNILPGIPFVESPLFAALAKANVFGQNLPAAAHLHQHGFVVVNLGRERMTRMAAYIKADLEDQFDLERWHTGEGITPSRIKDAWETHKSVKELALLPELLQLLESCWGRQPFGFQTLNFPVGTEQHFHSDAVHFHSEPPGFMCGIWIPLEDIHPDAGPLEYFPGSHRLPYLQAKDVGVKQQPGVIPGQEIFDSYWRMAIESQGLERQLFTPKLGQALIWMANLLHGGAAVKDHKYTRWSQVTHYFFKDCSHYTPILSDWPEGPVAWRNPFDIALGSTRDSVSTQYLRWGELEALAAEHGWTFKHLQQNLNGFELIEHALLLEAVASIEAGAADFSLALMEWALHQGSFSSPWLQEKRACALVDLKRIDEAIILWKELSAPSHQHPIRKVALEMLARFEDHKFLIEALRNGELDQADRHLDRFLQQGQKNTLSDWQRTIAELEAEGLIPMLLPLLELRIDSQPSQGLSLLIDGLRDQLTPAALDQLFRVGAEAHLGYGWHSASAPAVLIAHLNTGTWLQIQIEGPRLCRRDVAEHLGMPALQDSGYLISFDLPAGAAIAGLWLNGHHQKLEVRDLRGQPYLALVDQLLQLCQIPATPIERLPGLLEAGLGNCLQQLSAPWQQPVQWQGLLRKQQHFGQAAENAEITVVIPLYRRWDFMLGHVAGFSIDPWFKEQRVRLLYVIDDPTIEEEVFGWCRGQLSDEILDVSVVSLHRNSGFALACNIGVQSAQTPYVCLLNSDVLPIKPGWLQPLFRSLLLTPEALLAPLLLTDEGKIQHAGMEVQPLGMQGLPACVHSLKGLDEAQLKQRYPEELPYEASVLSGAALMFEREQFLASGGFDPVFGRGDFEDLEFSLRWRRNGGRLMVVPSARLIHLERQSITHDVEVLAQWRGVVNAWQAKDLCLELH